MPVFFRIMYIWTYSRTYTKHITGGWSKVGMGVRFGNKEKNKRRVLHIQMILVELAKFWYLNSKHMGVNFPQRKWWQLPDWRGT